MLIVTSLIVVSIIIYTFSRQSNRIIIHSSQWSTRIKTPDGSYRVRAVIRPSSDLPFSHPINPKLVSAYDLSDDLNGVEGYFCIYPK